MFVSEMTVTQPQFLDGFNIGSGNEVILFLSFRIVPSNELENNLSSWLCNWDLWDSII